MKIHGLFGVVYIGLIGLVVVPVAGAVGTNYWVDITNVTGQQSPYTNEAMAATNIQFAVNEAGAGDTIWIKPGEYKLPTNHVVVAGVSNVVTVDGFLVNLRATGSAADTIINGEGKYRGIYLYEDQWDAGGALIEGLTITNCYAPASPGGGIWMGIGRDWTGEVRNCVIVDNAAGTEGGGIYAEQDVLIITNSIFRANVAETTVGGALSAPVVGSDWGVEWLHVTDCLFENNRAQTLKFGQGGAIYLGAFKGQFLFENSAFVSNVAFVGGSDVGGGGAIKISAHNYEATARNCLFLYNKGNRGGAIIILSNNNVTWRFLNCTLSGNNGYNGAGRSAFYVKDGGTGCLLSISNSVVYGNGTLYDIDDLPDTGWVVSFHHNVIGSIANPTDVPDFAANSNTTANPLFVDAAGGDFRLQETSPAVNTGTNQPAWMTDAVDLEGNPRIDWWGLVVDRGCYERTPAKPQGTTIMVQ